MKGSSLLLAILSILTCANHVNAQTPLYPRPKIDDGILFPRTIPASLLEKIKKSQERNAGLPQKPDITNFSTNMNDESLRHPRHQGDFHLTRDINDFSASSYPGNNPRNGIDAFAVDHDILYFGADDGVRDDGLQSAELWRSDGTEEGTFLVKSIHDVNISSRISTIIAANGRIFFSIFRQFSYESAGWEPWVSDGTAAGTHVLDYSTTPSAHQSDVIPQIFTLVGDKVYMNANSFGSSDLFVIDINTLETSFLHNFWTDGSPIPSNRDNGEPTAINDLLFFVAGISGDGVWLWKSDGTPAGTIAFKKLQADQGSGGDIYHLTPFNGQLFFDIVESAHKTLWQTDGTPAGTKPVQNPGGIFILNLDCSFNLGDQTFPTMDSKIYFGGIAPTNEPGLYTLDPNTNTGILLVKNFPDGTDFLQASLCEIRSVNNKLFFKLTSTLSEYHEELWTSDGTSGNTHAIKKFGPQAFFGGLTPFSGKIFFREFDPQFGVEPWISNGTEEGTTMLKDLFPGSAGSNPTMMTPNLGKVFFSAEDPMIGTELWETDGSSAGTIPVKDINKNSLGSGAGGSFLRIDTFHNSVLFGATEPRHGIELYTSDGTEDGTILLNDIVDGPGPSDPREFRNKNGFEYFAADLPEGIVIFKSDGTKQGLTRASIPIDRRSSFFMNFNVTETGLVLYLISKNTGFLELWRSDGTLPGTYLLSGSLTISHESYIVTTGNNGFFAADDGIHGPQLWVTNGTIPGTKMVKNINPSGQGSYPYSLFPYKGEVYFGATDGSPFYSLWKTDGTSRGTKKVKDVTPAFWDYATYHDFLNYDYQFFCKSGNHLFFSAENFTVISENGPELWKTKGEARNTKMVKNISPGDFAGSFPSNLVDVDGTLFFIANDGTHGFELWRSEGHESDTKLVKDITPGQGSSLLGNLVSAGGHLFFINQLSFDQRLWKASTNGNANPVVDPAIEGLNITGSLVGTENKLYFNATSQEFGSELWVGELKKDGPHFNGFRTEEKPTVKSAESKLGMALFPNPSHGPVFLQLNSAEPNVTISISNASGESLWETTVSKMAIIQLPVEKLASGIYFVTVKNSKGKNVLKMIRQ